MDRGAWQVTIHGVTRVGHDWTTKQQRFGWGESKYWHLVHILFIPLLTLGHISSVQFSSVVQLCLTLCDPMDWSMPGFPVHHQFSELTQTHVHWVDDNIQPSHPLSYPSPPTFSHSQHQGMVFSNESVLCIRWPKYWSFSFSISPSNGYSGLISFRMDWLDLLEVQGTLKSLLQHYSLKASIRQHSAFFIVQLSHSYTTTGKTRALARWTSVDKIMSLF